ncbi:hypothetical protein [Piscinibacter sakaiensis]|uniref:hypothetical protein n=1 Tax=Piscinibacter sakaiensis TaxID=1547922 RepID=UPI003AB05842
MGIAFFAGSGCDRGPQVAEGGLPMTATGTTIAARTSPDAPTVLGEQTASSLLRNIMHVLCKHFWVLQACGVLPVLPILVAHEILAARQDPLMLITFPIYLLALFLSSGALTVAISDICIGNRPRVRRSFARVLSHRRWWYLLTTMSVLYLGIGLGLILLIIPGVWLGARGLFTSIIVVLEAKRNTGAIRRSFDLTKGQAWRVAGLALLPLLLAYIAVLLFGVGLMFGAELLGAGPVADEPADTPLMMGLSSLGFGLVTPVLGIALVLLYYDQRVRREAYDAQVLSEDLMR